MNHNRWLRIQTFVGCGPLSGCMFMTNHALQVMDVDAPKVINPGDAPDGWPRPPWSFRTPQVAIAFSTNIDIWEFAQSAEYHVGIDVTACTDGVLDPTRELQSSVYVYTRSGEFDSFSEKPPADMGRYRIYFSLKPFPTRSDRPKTFRYDLAADPMDVCFRIRGGNMIGGNFYSNTIMVPGATIRNALSEAAP